MKLAAVYVSSLLLVLNACTGHTPYRTQTSDSPCAASAASAVASTCEHQVWERVGNDYDVFYVEFDDMGLQHPKGGENVGEAWNQIEYTMQKLGILANEGGISLVVYVHGWKHNASAEDENVREFHQILKRISLVEQARDAKARRRVVGIYVGWRGLSVDVDPIEEASFWARKSAALHVAQGSARNFLVRLKVFQISQNCSDNPSLCGQTADPNQNKTSPTQAKVRMILIGHSFGGLIVFNAISGSLVESLTEEGHGSAEGSHGIVPVQRFGDMVILLNPAFEAIRYTPLQRVAARRKYTQYQAPILVMITSAADVATGTFFKWGRQINSILEHSGSAEESTANVNTPGHVKMYITHKLTEKLGNPTCLGWKDPETVNEMQTDVLLEAKAASF